MSTWRGVMIGAVTLLAVSAIKLLLVEQLGYPTPFLWYFGAVLAAAWTGGLRAGVIVTVAAGVLAAALFQRPLLHPALDSAHALQLLSFGVEGVAISWLTSLTHRSRADASARTDEAKGTLARLDAVMNAVDVGLTVQDVTGKLVFANDAAAKLIGFETGAQMLTGTPSETYSRFELFTPEGVPMTLDQLPGRVLLKGGAPAEQLVRFRLPGAGSDRWSVVRAAPVRDAEGRLLYALNLFRDVTERHRNDEALRESREWFSTALKSIGDAVITTSRDGVVTFLNPVAEQLTGWSQAEATGRPLAEVFQLYDEASGQPVEAPASRVLRESAAMGLGNHTVLQRRGGGRTPIADSAAPIRTAGGQVSGVVMVFRDVSAARRNTQRSSFLARATEALSSSLDWERTLATTASLAVPGFADWCTVDLFVGDELQQLAVAHAKPEQAEAVRELMRRYPPGPGNRAGPYAVRASGRPEWVREVPAALIDQLAHGPEHAAMLKTLGICSYLAMPLKRGSEVVGVLSFVSADSKRHYDEEDLRLAVALAERASVAIENARLFREAEAARRDAQTASRAKDEFLAVLGHELRNPLAPIATAVELMKLRAPDALKRERQLIERQVNHLVRLVDDLLDVSRITRGKVELKREAVRVGEVIERALETVSPLLEQRQHRVHAEVGDGLAVLGDAERLTQVVANLLTNSAKYTEPGGRIELTARRDGADAVLTVKDEGIGITPEVLPHVFESFVQGPRALDRAQGGLGLGLAIVKTLVEAHGGSVRALSEGIGRGATFEVRLKAMEAPVDAPAVRESAPRQLPQAGRTRVLVVDDNDDVRESLVEVLSESGYETHAAPDGPAALQKATEVEPAVAVLDIGLPVMDGYELARRMRETPQLGQVKLVALTGYGQAADKDRAKNAGFDAHLVKPISIDKLLELLEHLAPHARS